jgi:mono/diheme cytochrome c family protein
MRAGSLLLAAIVSLAAADVAVAGQATPAGQAAPAAEPAARHQAVLKRYCISCHNQRLKTAGLVLEGVDPATPSAQAATWEKVVAKLRTGAMPPAGLPRPDAATANAMASFLEAELDRAAAARPNPGLRPPLHRLNRAEYQSAVRDLLALDDLPKEVDIAVLLPADDSSFGFDNIADVLGTSPTLLERYLAAAQKISRLAIGDPATPMIVDTYRVPQGLPQEERFEGMPLGTRGGLSIRRFFPLDGEYLFRVAVGGPRSSEPHELEIAVDGQRMHVFTIDDRGRPRNPASPMAAAPERLEIRRKIAAGPHLVTVSFVRKTGALSEDILPAFSRSGQSGGAQQPSLTSVTISGPEQAAAGGETPSRRRVFTCHPSKGANEATCAKEILTTLARRAYRRTPDAADLQVLTTFYEEGRAEGGFEAGIQRALERVLVSPAFLFRAEGPRPTRTTAAPSGAWRISEFELASRLSFFFWSSIPDDELLDLAAKGRLRDAATLERQVRRMLADSRAGALTDNFAAQWLFLRNLDAASPDPRLFPDFDEALRRAMRRETELFFESIVREDRPVHNLLTANDTFVNERLAKHYGIPNVYGDRFRRVTLGGTRRGLLGQASVLTVTSYSHRTSPVMRGKWVLENIMGAPPPPPPPDVPALEEKSKGTGKALTMREAMAQHRANPSCSGCHARMDPIGLALENFDAVGRWRTEFAGTPIDASGVLPDGSKFSGVDGLLEAMTRDPGRFTNVVAEKLLTYALGRGLEFYDAPAVRAIAREAAAGGYRFSALVLGIVKSAPFQMRMSGDAVRVDSAARRP